MDTLDSLKASPELSYESIGPLPYLSCLPGTHAHMIGMIWILCRDKCDNELQFHSSIQRIVRLTFGLYLFGHMSG